MSPLSPSSIIVLKEMSPGRYRKVLDKCTSTDPSKRYRSVQELREALFKRSHWPYNLAALAVVMFIAGLLLWQRGAKDVVPDVPPATAPAAAADSLPAAGKDSSVRVRPNASPKPAKAQAADEVDRIFQQASDLFESALD